MIGPISTTNVVFKSYRQHFTDEVFQEKLAESVVCAKENVDNLAYFRPKFLMDKKIEKEGNLAFPKLEEYRQEFKKSDFLPHVDLFIYNKELVGRVSYLNSKPVEITTEMPCTIDKFFREIKKCAQAQIKQEELNQLFWENNEAINYAEAQQRQRYKELSPALDKPAGPLLLYFDKIYSDLSDKILKLYKEKEEIYSKLAEIKLKLCDKNFSIKKKIKL